MTQSLSVSEFAAKNPEFASAWSVHEAIRKDLIPHYKVGRRVFIDPCTWHKFKQAGGSCKSGEWRRICGGPESTYDAGEADARIRSRVSGPEAV